VIPGTAAEQTTQSDDPGSPSTTAADPGSLTEATQQAVQQGQDASQATGTPIQSSDQAAQVSGTLDALSSDVDAYTGRPSADSYTGKQSADPFSPADNPVYRTGPRSFMEEIFVGKRPAPDPVTATMPQQGGFYGDPGVTLARQVLGNLGDPQWRQWATGPRPTTSLDRLFLIAGQFEMQPITMIPGMGEAVDLINVGGTVINIDPTSGVASTESSLPEFPPETVSGFTERGYYSVTTRPTYLVRTGGGVPGRWGDHLFESLPEARNYAQKLASTGEQAIRETSALPRIWPGGAQGNPIRSISIFEVRPETGNILGAAAPQLEGGTVFEAPLSYSGGGPQVVIGSGAQLGPPVADIPVAEPPATPQ
jgi:hypothetical protein